MALLDVEICIAFPFLLTLVLILCFALVSLIFFLESPIFGNKKKIFDFDLSSHVIFSVSLTLGVQFGHLFSSHYSSLCYLEAG